LLLPLAMTLAGALGFNRMRRRADAQQAAARVAGVSEGPPTSGR